MFIHRARACKTFPVGLSSAANVAKCGGRRGCYNKRSSDSIGGFQRTLPSFEDDRAEILNISFTSTRAKQALERYHELRTRTLQGGNKFYGTD